jgi:hypothetical protein
MCSAGKVANGTGASGAAITPATAHATIAPAPATPAGTAFPADRI